MTRLALCLLLLATGASMQLAHAEPERQLSPHETQPEPTPALAPGRWIDERYEL
ncbi:hypothetical protein I5O09_01990 [Pseudomonas parafulva]|uniref:hypothetical protein n=1 Tax=Pseudomonas parafulva TaxID=157782 RepID=UPI0018D807FA|nr:hypothetical protein [Pseudomonas parafulva]MBH3342506.1 hypothetical protein [Pseudomonas parafulva]